MGGLCHVQRILCGLNRPQCLAIWGHTNRPRGITHGLDDVLSGHAHILVEQVFGIAWGSLCLQQGSAGPGSDQSALRIASASSSGLVNCGQWLVGSSMMATSLMRARSPANGCAAEIACSRSARGNVVEMIVTGTS